MGIKDKIAACVANSTDLNQDGTYDAKELGRAARNAIAWKPCSRMQSGGGAISEQMAVPLLKEAAKRGVSIDLEEAIKEGTCTKNFHDAKLARCAQQFHQRDKPFQMLDPDMPPEGPQGCGLHTTCRRKGHKDAACIPIVAATKITIAPLGVNSMRFRAGRLFLFIL